MLIKFTQSFRKQYQKAPLKIRNAFTKRSELFLNNQNHPLLNLHSLKGQYSGYSSINITGDWRAIFQIKEINNKSAALFSAIGTHSQLYK